MHKRVAFNKVSYGVALISEFAKRHKLSDPVAFRYLLDYNAIKLIDEEYDIAHTLSFEEMVDNLTVYCQRQGGRLS